MYTRGMDPRVGGPHRLSLFSRRLDTVLFVVYLLGAIVPLAALGFLVQKYALPARPDQRTILLAVVVSIAILSLAAFLALRRVAKTSLQRLNEDNRRLSILLAASSDVAGASHDQEILNAATSGASQIAGSKAAFFARRKPDGNLEITNTHGSEGGLFSESYGEALLAAAAHVIESQSPGLAPLSRSNASAKDLQQAPRVLAVPCIPSDTQPGALLVPLPTSASQDPAPLTNVLWTLARLTAGALQRSEMQEAQRNYFTHLTHLLVTALDSHLDYKVDHSKRVAFLSSVLGHELDFDEDRQQRLYFSALLHDVGMLEVDKNEHHIQGSVRKHPALGYDMLQRISLWQDLAPIVLHHHEWFDGHGYPTGIAGDKIPLESRIVGIAEAFDSMTNMSSYKTPITVVQALERVREGSGTQFDPDLVKVFLRLAEEGAFEQ